MALSRARRMAASLVTRGQIDSIAEEVQAALIGDYPRSDADESLSRLLRHATSTVPAYRGFDPSELESFPVISKTEIKSRPEQFISSAFSGRALTSVSTSGSTGVPFVSYRDPAKRLRHRGSLVGTFAFQGADPFGPRVVSKAWGSDSIVPKTISVLQQEVRHSAGSVMSPSTPRLTRWLKRHPGALLMGYSSYLEQIMREIELHEGELPVPLGSLIGASEPASEYLISQAQGVFGTPLQMRYSNMENGMIAVSRSDTAVYHIDTSSFKIEILDEESDQPAEPGTLGRIVVTDLFNYGMPFIRYDTGDLATWAETSNGHRDGSAITGIAGRRLDTITLSEGNPPKSAHALQIWAPTAQLAEIRQFQLRQHGIGEFTWVLNADRSQQLEEKLYRILVDRIGDIVNVHYEYVSDVPVLASGKRQFFVNEIANLGGNQR